MPLYEYLCEANGRTIEVRHGMTDTLDTWGDVCRTAGLEPGDTPVEAPVRRKISRPVLTGGESEAAGGPEPCGPACGCVH